jgi:thiamine pyrophosphate-dependent acetolactate synthase large subunit-like protein
MSPSMTHQVLELLSVPIETRQTCEWGSDVIAAMLARLGVEYAAIVPGSSFRGLHDSLVNFLGNRQPGIILCNHEETTVALAHGYAKASGRPMAAIVHSNVGLLHASMAIYNAWCDRVPVYVLGATGPMDATQRRPWIDWIHTAHGQGQVVRDYTKWEHQPASIDSIPEAMLRAWRTMLTEPRGPVYLCFDAGHQEAPLAPDKVPDLPDLSHYARPKSPPPHADQVEVAARMLVDADYPVILAGRIGHTRETWSTLVSLAERLGAAVLTDLKTPASFPTNHPLHMTWPSTQPGVDVAHTLRDADLVLALDWIDPGGTLLGGGAQSAKLINVSMEDYAVRSWAADYQRVPPARLSILSTPELTIESLRVEVDKALGSQSAQRRATDRLERHRETHRKLEAEWEAARIAAWNAAPLSLTRVVGELVKVLGDRPSVLVRSPLQWPAGIWHFTRPGSWLGYDGGAGLGSGPGMAVGAALALRDRGALPVAILGDGDLLMAPSALWTAAHHRLPLLLIVANNQTYLNDEAHQSRVARTRGRPLENHAVGLRMDQPAVNFAALATSLGVEGFGPVERAEDLARALANALNRVDEGRPVLVDVRIRRE